MARTVLGSNRRGAGFTRWAGSSWSSASELDTPFGKAVRLLLPRPDGARVEVVFSLAPRPGPSDYAFGIKLSREYLRDEAARRRAPGVGEHGGQYEEEVAPGDLVVVNQFVDHTYKRPATFFGAWIVGHVSLADPVCADLSRDLVKAARATGARSMTAACIFVSRDRSSRRAPIEYLSGLGCRRYQHDRHAGGGGSRAGGRALLRRARAGDRLRLLASERQGGRYLGEILRVMRAQCRSGTEGRRERNAGAGGRRRTCACGML